MSATTEYVWRSALLQAIGTLRTSGQIFCASECAKLYEILHGLNPKERSEVKIVQALITELRETKALVTELLDTTFHKVMDGTPQPPKRIDDVFPQRWEDFDAECVPAMKPCPVSRDAVRRYCAGGDAAMRKMIAEEAKKRHRELLEL